MLDINPNQRISAIDALMHDFCIVNKRNYKEKQRKPSICIPSAEDFLSQYSLEGKSRQKSISHVNSLKSLQRMNKSSLICISTEDVTNNRRNATSVQDLSSQSVTRPVDPFSAHVLMLMGSYEKITNDSPNPNNLVLIKKSKFADEG